MAPLASESLDLDPANPSSLDIITATRAGTATYTDASGNIQTASPNTVRVDHVQGAELTPTKSQLVGYTDFSSGWLNNGSSDVAGSGYSGEPSVVITGTQNNASLFFYCPAVVGQEYIISMYIRRVSGTGTIRMRHVFAVEGTATDVTITNDWSRVEVPFTANSTSIPVGPQMAVNGDSIEIAMPQVEEGATASDFVENTTGSPKYFAAATYAPRVPMMLIEPAATNTARYSESAVNYNYNSGITKETTNELAPNGQASAFKITPDGSNITVRSGSSYTYSGSYNAGDVVSVSMWLKTDGYDYFVRVGGFFGSEGALFDTIDGSNVSNEANVISASSEDYGNGWFRYKVTYTFQNTINNNYLYAGLRLYKRDASGNPTSWDATGETTGILVYGTQFELGSLATSYIPTDNNIDGVTRAADDLVIDGSDFTNFYNQSEGTVYIEWQREATNTVYPFTISDGSSANYIRINNASTCRIKTGSSEQASLSLGSSNTGQINRAAVSFAANNFDGSKNGGAVVSDSAGTTPTVNQLQIGGIYTQGSEINGHIKRLIYWPHHSDNI